MEERKKKRQSSDECQRSAERRSRKGTGFAEVEKKRKIDHGRRKIPAEVLVTCMSHFVQRKKKELTHGWNLRRRDEEGVDEEDVDEEGTRRSLTNEKSDQSVKDRSKWKKFVEVMKCHGQ
ncbi:hypothetical protein N7456_008495 [Penicillium angulare]|uniref:Uncharacterized protein n=1 Tax=Penicillium angulare TaxID=116970 RepID=A0A9W9FCX8_9EURO|nr:hypothetical protein N7456_008495 [Penicillium angulare]